MAIRSVLILPLLCFALIGHCLEPGNPEAGLEKSKDCVACHNADGNSTTSIWPKLAGQHERYLAKQIREIRKGDEGKRSVPTMYAMVANISDQDVLDLAAYFASQTQSEGTANQAYVELGRRIYHGGLREKGVTACATCHSPAGKGNEPANFPMLSGQHADYTESQLVAFKEGTRTNDVNGIMQDIGMRLSEEEMKAVSSYIEGLR